MILPSLGLITVRVSVNWMRIFRVAARLVMCGSSVSMSWRAATTTLPPGFACAYADSGAKRRRSAATVPSRSFARVMMVSLISGAQPVRRVRDRLRRRHEVSQPDPLVRSRPLLVDPDVAGAVLNGGDAGGSQD